MLPLVALLLLVVLLGAVLAAYGHLANRVRRLEEANAVLLDLVSTHMTLGPADQARLTIATGSAGARRSGGGSREG